MSIKTDSILSSWKGVSMEVNGMSYYYSQWLMSSNLLEFLLKSNIEVQTVKYVIGNNWVFWKSVMIRITFCQKWLELWSIEVKLIS